MNKPNSVTRGEIDLSRVKGILFDIDGTLSDTDDHMVNQFIRFLRPVKWMFKDHNPRGFARWSVMAAETPANFIYGLADRFGLDNLYAKIYNRRARKQPLRKQGKKNYLLIPGVKHMLEELYGRYPMGVVSARDEKTSVAFLETFSLRDYFEVIVTAQTCPHTKPYPDPIIFAAEKLGLASEDCIMVGDTIVDMRAGNSAGAQTIGVQCGFGTFRELEKASAAVILEKTPDILDLLIMNPDD